MSSWKRTPFENYHASPKVRAARTGNWFAIDRSMIDHPIVGAGQVVKAADPSRGSFSRFEAWQYLISHAQYIPRSVDNKGHAVVLQRGQLMAARSKLAKDWNWPEKIVRGFLSKLEKQAMIKKSSIPHSGQRRGQGISIITICNYDHYQGPGVDPRPIKGPTTGHPRATATRFKIILSGSCGPSETDSCDPGPRSLTHCTEIDDR
ncbi:hypothetical protein HYPP_02698 [Hyphomicrobium sp. ghe19]|nr:hypothetical protein HYPP_02698 [Hyphomicrobium sp. ghe19]